MSDALIIRKSQRRLNNEPDDPELEDDAVEDEFQQLNGSDIALYNQPDLLRKRSTIRKVPQHKKAFNVTRCWQGGVFMPRSLGLALWRRTMLALTLYTIVMLPVPPFIDPQIAALPEGDFSSLCHLAQLTAETASQ